MLDFWVMRRLPLRAWAAVIISAALQIYMFPMAGPVGPWRSSLCWVALVPLLMALAQKDRDGSVLRPWRNALLGYVCGALFYFGNCFWIYQTMYLYGGLPKPVSFVILILFSLYLGLYHGLFALLFAMVRRSRFGLTGAVVAAPFCWVAVELARARVTGFPWDLLGNAQVDNLLVTRIAPVAGVMGISFGVAAVNASVAWFVVGGKRRFLVPAVGLILALGLQLGGQYRRDGKETPTQVAVMVQENLEVGAVGKQVRPLTQAEELQEFTALSLRPQVKGADGAWSTRGLGPDVTLIVWPEAPSHFQTNDPSFVSAVGNLAKTAGVPVISGSLGVDTDRRAGRGYFLYDSASFFDEMGTYTGRYDKIHLVPWGEYVPFKRFFSFAEKLTEGVGDMDAGHDRGSFHAGGHTYGVFICYESIFGDEVREFVKNGAEVLVNISDDGWYGDTGAPWQHLNMARMRAIENHRWVVRSTNTGITTAIDPWGRVGVEAPRHVRGSYAIGFGFESGMTTYARFGDWWAWLCVVVTLGLVGFGWRERLFASAKV